VAEYRRPRHRTVARILAAIDATVLMQTNCGFGGGTRIALELDEYRESEDIDFLCSDLTGYRTLREGIGERSLGALMPTWPAGIALLRDVRADQYGIRTVIGVDGAPVKFEIILEARIALAPVRHKKFPVPVLDRASCFAEKWLANADRWNDSAVLSRDAIDLAFMLQAWEADAALTGSSLATAAYGNAIRQCALDACAKLRDDAAYRKHCVGNLAIGDTRTLAAGLRRLEKMAQAMS
jgi:hypothetical protein